MSNVFHMFDNYDKIACMLQDRDKIVNFFVKKLDLKEGEVAIYLELLKMQSGTVLQLAHATGMNRITVHGYVNTLMRYGLISQTKKGSRRILVPEPLEKVEFLLEGKKQEIEQAEKELPQVLESIKEIIPRGRTDTSVILKYYEGKANVLSVYKETLRASLVCSFVDLDKYYEIFPDTTKMWEDALDANPRRELFTIAVDSELARQISATGHARYHSKFISGEQPFAGLDFHIYGNKVAIIQLEQTNPVAIVIISRLVAAGLLSIHRVMWGLLN